LTLIAIVSLHGLTDNSGSAEFSVSDMSVTSSSYRVEFVSDSAPILVDSKPVLEDAGIVQELKAIYLILHFRQQMQKDRNLINIR
jgi:hypothetical protein